MQGHTGDELKQHPITVIGAGAIGGTVGAFLTQAGYDVTLVDVVAEHVYAMNRDGLRFTGCRGDLTIPVNAILARDLETPLGATLLCVKGHHTEATIQSIAPLLKPDGFVVSLQNGLNEEVIARVIGNERTLGAFVHFGADYLEPGLIQLGYEATIHPGELDGAITPRIENIAAMLTNVMPVEVTDNIWGYLWGKLVYGAMAFVTACVDATVPDVIDNPLGMRLCQAAAAEAHLVASTQTAVLERIGTFDPNAFAPGSAFNARSRATLLGMADEMRGAIKQHMGIWRDLKIKKRKTEVDVLLTVVSERARTVGVPTPVIDAVVETIHAIEEGRRGMTWANLDAIAEAQPALLDA